MFQWMLAIWSLVPLPFPKPAWTSGSSWFHVLLKPGFENFEHYFASVWGQYIDTMKCLVFWNLSYDFMTLCTFFSCKIPLSFSSFSKKITFESSSKNEFKCHVKYYVFYFLFDYRTPDVGTIHFLFSIVPNFSSWPRIRHLLAIL